MFARSVSAAAVLALLLASAPARAVTPAQNAMAEARAKLEQAARAKFIADMRKHAEMLARNQAEQLAKAKAIAIGKVSVHHETQLRLAAARKAAEAHARIASARTGTLGAGLAVRAPAAGKTAGRRLAARHVRADENKHAVTQSRK